MTKTQPSSAPGDEVEDANEDEKYQETELFEDTLVLDSHFTETDVEMLNLNTEIVEDSEPIENMITDTTCEDEPEVVLDSEDEEMNCTGKVNVAKGFLEDKSSPVVNNYSVLSKKRLFRLPYEQANSTATTSVKSCTGHKGAAIDAESFDGNNHQYLPARLYRAHSPEPEDSIEDALGFVDRYLSSNNVDMFQAVQNGKITMEKSPHVSSAKGILSLLSKKTKARTQIEDKDPFKWVGSDQNEKEAEIFCKKVNASSNFGNHGLTYKRRRQEKGSHIQNNGNCSASNRCDESSVQEPRSAADNKNFLKELDIESCATREDVKTYSSVACLEDMSDIGLDTQIAVEAMDALARLPPNGFHFNDTHQPENTFDGSLSDLEQNHQKDSLCKESPGLHSIALKSYKRNVSSYRYSKVTSSSYGKHTNNQKSDPVSGRLKKKIGSKSTVEGQFKNDSSSLMCSKHVSLEQVCLLGEDVSFKPAAKETKNQNKSIRTRIKHQPSHPTERNNNIEEEGIIRDNRMGNCLVADPVNINVTTKCLKLSTSSCGVATKGMLNHQVQVNPQLSATSSFSKIYSWTYPKGPRGKRKRANARRIFCIDNKESNFYSARSLEVRDVVHKSCLPPVSSGDAIKFQNLHNTHPLLLAHVKLISDKSVAQSSSEISASVAPSEGIQNSNANHKYNEHCKKACEKNLRKSSLLKELIRLGVPKSTSEMMKDMRHRRDMTHVRVLFSQHLDDSVLKQQKKILARLNISTASSSMEATHFIADRFTRTKNMLETMALGKLVLTHLWLESCGQANCFIGEKNYILRDMKKEKEIGFSMPVSLARARQKPLLKGKRVYITPHIKPDKEVVAGLVTAVHGQLVDENQIFADKNDDILDDLLILSCEEDYAICRHFLERGAAVYSSEVVLNGIVIQKLELESCNN
ncbi:uncharacterized protein [Cicer arietinum]|uniref:Uncharacterized protein LOC101495959 isoform X2 n=1 Tax=Cicer arietinum TaxID=3827 RepID=A0A1S3E184_CICAR|nr:uncharacterized protein LOC101495959 isoform X2 [Cicer arietinum]